MAWISVHEQVIGPKLRTLSKCIGCSQNESLGILVRLWLWAINNSDKYGFILGANKEDLADVLCLGLDTRFKADDVIDCLIESQWLEVSEDRIIIHDWIDWQEQWYKALERREKDTIRKRNERERKALEKANLLKKTSPKESEPKQEVKTDSYDSNFNEFWEVYPRKIGKADAYKCYKARLKDGWSPKEIKQAAEKYRDLCIQKHTEKEYIKHPKTFLSATTPFADYINIAKSNSSEDNNPYGEWGNQ